MQRPRRHDENVIHLAASMLWERLKVDRPELVNDEEGDDEHACGQLRRALQYAQDGDGFEIAKELDHLGWDVDASLVGELDGGCLDAAHDELVKKWLAWHAKKPALAIGATVTVHPGQFDRDKHVACGVITEISTERGTYTVNVPAWGHVLKGSGTHGQIWEWEVLEGWQQAATVVAPVPTS